MAQERQDAALARVEEVAGALAQLAWQLERTAGELETALADLGVPSRDDGAADQLRVSEYDEAEGARAEHVALVEEPRDGGDGLERGSPRVMGRRSGVDRRTGEERRRAQPEGLAARIFGAIERRVCTERRSGVGRRADDLSSSDVRLSVFTPTKAAGVPQPKMGLPTSPVAAISLSPTKVAR